jgi:membrane associated rhomboid family serine protease
MRNFGGGGSGFPGLDSMSAKLAVALVFGSALFLATREGLGGVLLLMPSLVVERFTLWQLLTYAFIETTPLGIIFGALITWSIGGWLEASWGSKRLLWVAVGTTVAAGLLTVLVGLVTPVAPYYAGGTVLTSVLWVAYGLAIGRGQANFWGMPLSGNALAGIGAAFVVFQVLAVGWRSQLPEIFGLVLIYAYVKGGSPRRLWLHFQHWRLQRQLRERSKHLHVVPRDRPDQDRYLN